MRFAFCNEGFEGRAWGGVCTAIARAGYDGVEVAPFTFASSVLEVPRGRRAEIHSSARAAGLDVVGLHWLFARTEGLHVGHPDAAVRGRTRDYLCHLADFCADVGGATMVFGSPQQRGPVGEASAEDTWRWAAETIAGACATLSARRVTLCIEPLAPDEATFITTAAEARRLVDQLAHPNVRLILDVKAMSAETDPIADLIHRHAAVLAHVHANDANRQGPGFGDTDFRPILAALRETGYDGVVSVEPFEFRPDPDTVARRSIRYLRECSEPQGAG